MGKARPRKLFGSWTRRRTLLSISAALVVALVSVPVALVILHASGAHADTQGVSPTPGTVYAWGDNGDGDLGTVSSDICAGYPCSVIPLAVSALTTARAIAGGGDHTLALMADGSVYAWGGNTSGQLGVTTQQTCTGAPCSPIPVQVTGLPAIAGVASGGYHSLAVTTTGAVYAWGDNSYGQLGTGNAGGSTPTLVPGLPGNVTAVAATGNDSLALTSSGAVYAWGDNSSGQLGATTATTCGTSPCSPTPVQVSGLTGVTAIASGGGYNLALTSSGTVYAWGDNSTGTLGNGTTTNSTTPVQVTGLSNVTAIAAGSHALALTSSGTVYAWGQNMFGELGATTTQICSNGYYCSTTPLQVAGLPSTITAISAAGHSLALASDGSVWAWGTNDLGELGIGSSDPNPHQTPTQVTSLTGATAVATGGNFSLAIASAGAAPSPTPTSTPSGVASLSATSILFADQQLGTTSPQHAVWLTNTGTGMLNITGAALSGPNPGDFVLVGGSCTSSPGNPVSLQPGSSCSMDISFQPTGTGTRSGTLTVTCDGTNCPISGSVTGNGINPISSVSPTSLSFPSTYIGSSSAAQTVTVSNSGTTNLVISGIASGAPNPGDFSFSAPGMPITVAPGGSTTISVTFTPQAGGARSAILGFATNDSLHPLSVALNGTGLLTADLSLTMSASPNPVRTRTKLTYSITVSNSGPGASASPVMSDPLPSGTTFYSVTTTMGTCSAPAVGATGTVSCSTNSLPSGSSFTVTLVVTVTASGGTTLSNIASVSSSTQDPNPANNSAAVATSVSKH
jgi:uncharacterized repeat protein (TIGR01451 family)